MIFNNSTEIPLAISYQLFHFIDYIHNLSLKIKTIFNNWLNYL